MSNSILTFDFSETPVRVQMIEDAPWFVVADVCRVLEHSNGSAAIRALDADDLSNAYLIDSLGRKQAANVVNESGLYSLIFASRKKKAREFKRWVTKDVLPSIRKTGRYEMGTEDDSLGNVVALMEENAAAVARARDMVLDGTLSVEAAQTVSSLCGEFRASWQLRLKIQPAAAAGLGEYLPSAEIGEMLCAAAGRLKADGILQLGDIFPGQEMDAGQMRQAGRRLQEWRGRELTDAQGRKFRMRYRRTNAGARYAVSFNNTKTDA